MKSVSLHIRTTVSFHEKLKKAAWSRRLTVTRLIEDAVNEKLARKAA